MKDRARLLSTKSSRGRHALRQSAKAKSSKTKHASGKQSKTEVDSLSWRLKRASANLTNPFPTLDIISGFCGFVKSLRQIYEDFLRFYEISPHRWRGFASRPSAFLRAFL